MKKNAVTFLALGATVFMFSRCQHQESTHSAYFYTRENTAEQPLNLFVEGQSVGNLPHFGTALTCASDSLKQQALQLTLKSGKYHLEAKDNQGTVKSSGSLKISESGIGSKGSLGDKGGMAVSANGTGNSCVIVDLFY